MSLDDFERRKLSVHADAYIAKLEAAIRQSQDAIAQCLRAGGTITDGEETPWWNAIIAAQKNMAVVIRDDK